MRYTQKDVDEYIKKSFYYDNNIGRKSNRDSKKNFLEDDFFGCNLYNFPFNGRMFNHCNFVSTVLPSPLQVLQARWGEVSDELCIELMKFDAQNHPNPVKFNNWKNGQGCPYSSYYDRGKKINRNGIRSSVVARAISFNEKRNLWNPRYLNEPVKTPLELMLMLFKEKNITY